MFLKNNKTGEIVEICSKEGEWEHLHESDMPSKGDWIYELSSGYSGYRCKKCRTWIYSMRLQQCECDRENPTVIRKVFIKSKSKSKEGE